MSAESLRTLAGILSRPVDFFVLRFIRDVVTLSVLMYSNKKLVFGTSSVGRSTYTYKTVNCVNVYGRDATLDLG